MGILPCLSPQAGSGKETKHLNELKLVKAQLAEAKAIIAELQQGVRASCSPAPVTPPATTSVGVQAQPPVECESRIPRPEELVSRRVSAAGNRSGHSTTHASYTDPSAAQEPSATDKNDQQNSPKRNSSIQGTAGRGLPGSRIPATPSRKGVGRSHSAKIPASKAAATPAAAAARAATVEEASRPSPEVPAGAPCEAAAAALAASSHQARADLLSNQLKVSEAFRQSLESELRTLRLRSAALQTQVLSLQTTLERSMTAQVDELDKLAKLRKGGDTQAYEAAVAEAAALKRQLETSEALKAVAEQQAQAATELATSRQEQLSATQAEVSTLKAEAAASQARFLELAAEGAQLKQVTLTLNKAHARVEELEGVLTAAAQQATQAEAGLHEQINKLREELRTQKAITDSTCAELLSLSEAHSTLKQAHTKLELETKQHDKVVQIVQQELADMSYFAAAGRVALGLCAQDSGGPLVSAGQSVTPTALSPRVYTAAAAAAVHPQSGDVIKATKDMQVTEQEGAEATKGRQFTVGEDRSAISIAAAAAAGAAAVISISPAGSQQFVSKLAAMAEQGGVTSDKDSATAAAGGVDSEKTHDPGCGADAGERAGARGLAEGTGDQATPAAGQVQSVGSCPAPQLTPVLEQLLQEV